mmetsp:Transcript_136047/g.322399  ORF Transcript_136047/g.322399 Transcript_136047/m.322399 type:complete len:656 (+) Transcript_136047:56-2023(+)
MQSLRYVLALLTFVELHGLTVLDALSADRSLKTFLHAIQRAKLVSLLNGTGPLTLFAPLDDAFEKPEEFLNRSDLAELVRLHLATGSQELSGGAVQSLEGARLKVVVGEQSHAEKSHAEVNGAKVLGAELLENGALYRVGAVFARPHRQLLAGDGHWNGWSAQRDGKSTGQVIFEEAMVFSGNVDLDEAGSSVQKMWGTPLDLSAYAGLLLEVKSEPMAAATRAAPLGLRLLLRDANNTGEAAFAVPFSQSGPPQRCRVYIPISEFLHRDRRKSACENCQVDPRKISSMEINVVLQSGTFAVGLFSIFGVRRALDAPLPTAPSVQLNEAQLVKLIDGTIQTVGPICKEGYEKLCVAIYGSVARQVLAAKGISEELRGLACAGLHRPSAWALRRALDAARADAVQMPRVLEERYPDEAQGRWLPEPNQRPPAGLCQGLIDRTKADINLELGSTARSSLLSFEGPFVAKSIKGLNSKHMQVHSPAECAQLCLERTHCKSFDYGADGTVMGECYLNTANRTSAGSAFQTQRLYDYYELAEAAVDSVASLSQPSQDFSKDASSGAGDEARRGPVFLVFGAALGGVLLLGIVLGAFTIFIVHVRKVPPPRLVSHTERMPMADVMPQLPPTISLGSAQVPPTISMGSTSVVVVGQPVRDPV